MTSCDLKSANTYLKESRVVGEKGDYKSAILLPDKAILKDPDVASYEIYYERGLAYYSTHQIKRAFYDFQNCINQKYNLGGYHYMIGLCWLTANKKDEVCEAFKQGAFYGDSLSTTQVQEVCK